MRNKTEHEVVNIERWIAQFPIERYEKKDGPRKFPAPTPDDPVNLTKVRGTMITGPSHLARIEQVRRRVGREHDLGPAVPTDLILWGTGEPTKPYLTKIGGLPYRPADKPWPGLDEEDPFTFFAQFCFVDSRNILPAKLPGDVMLLFFRDEESFSQAEDEDAWKIEWYDIGIDKLVTARKCPKPSFPVPKLHGALYRTNEFPESYDIFEREGHFQYYLFGTTQASRIGGETFFIQDDPRESGEEILCTLNSIMPEKSEEFPFLNHEKPLTGREEVRMEFLFWDVGCLYFLIDRQGQVRWTLDCY